MNFERLFQDNEQDFTNETKNFKDGVCFEFGKIRVFNKRIAT